MEFCAVCGTKGKLTYEHMPPRAAGNAGAVETLGLENTVPLGGYMYKKSRKLRRGMGGYKLCERCNTVSGALYGAAYADFSTQVVSVIQENLGLRDVIHSFNFKPLNFLKQVMSIMLCSDQATGTLRSLISAKEFLLDKHYSELPPELYIGMDITVQRIPFGWKGYTSSYHSDRGFESNIQFSFFPFSFKLTIRDEEKGSPSQNIASWNRYKYDEVIDVQIPLKLKNFKLQNYR